MKINNMKPMHPVDQVSPEAKLRDAAKMYEQHFLGEMVKAMRSTLDHSSLTEPSMAQDIYSQQLDTEYVKSWSDQGGVGLADLIYDQMNERFFSTQNPGMKPQGPLPLNKNMHIKIDESRPQGIPIAPAGNPEGAKKDLSYLFEWSPESANEEGFLDVKAPFAGNVAQMYRSGDDRQVVKLLHDNGLRSTLSFLGQTKDLKLGDSLAAGQVIGRVHPNATGLAWQIGRGAV